MGRPTATPVLLQLRASNIQSRHASNPCKCFQYCVCVLRLAHRDANEAAELLLGIVSNHDPMLVRKIILDLLGRNGAVHSAQNEVGLGREGLQVRDLLQAFIQAPPLLEQCSSHILQRKASRQYQRGNQMAQMMRQEDSRAAQ